MEKYNCIIVEDEPLAAEVLQDYIKQIPTLALKGICHDAIYAVEIMQGQKIDLVFLDIHLPRLKGLDFIKTLSSSPKIIITTAYRDFAVEGFELNVLDYLLKPISFNRFLTAINKLKPSSQHDIHFVNNNTSIERPHLFINMNRKRVKIYLDDILFVESKREYISIVTKNRSYLTKFQLSEIEDQLTKNKFLRIHRSFLVSLSKIDAYSATDIEVSGKELPIGRSYKEYVLNQLGQNI